MYCKSKKKSLEIFYANDIFTPEKEYQSVVLSTDKFIKGKTYYVELGEKVYEVTIDNIGTALGTNPSGNNNQGYLPDGRPHR